LFFLPALLSILSFNFIGTKVKPIDLINLNFNSHQMIGVYILGLAFLISILNYPASIYFRVKSAGDKSSPSITECYRKGFELFLKVWEVEIVSYLLIIGGLVLLIIPGVIFFRRYWLSPYYVIENSNLPIKEILKKSELETKPYASYVYSTAGVAFLVTLLSSFLVGASTVGLIAEYIIGYSVLFLPVLRYEEITRKNDFPKS
jgi:hypothetical protein